LPYTIGKTRWHFEGRIAVSNKYCDYGKVGIEIEGIRMGMMERED